MLLIWERLLMLNRNWNSVEIMILASRPLLSDRRSEFEFNRFISSGDQPQSRNSIRTRILLFELGAGNGKLLIEMAHDDKATSPVSWIGLVLFWSHQPHRRSVLIQNLWCACNLLVDKLFLWESFSSILSHLAISLSISLSISPSISHHSGLHRHFQVLSA